MEAMRIDSHAVSLSLSIPAVNSMPLRSDERGYRLSLQARSFPLQGWGLIDLPLRATFSPTLPSDCFTIDFPGRAICRGEDLPAFYMFS